MMVCTIGSYASTFAAGVCVTFVVMLALGIYFYIRKGK